MSQELNKFFYPVSIAIIGASSKKGSLSLELISHLMSYGYNGRIFPVNPKAHSIHSVKAYSSLIDIEDEIDLAMIMVPRDLVLSAIDDCGKKNVKSVVVITAGFKETGEEGSSVETELLKKIEKYGMKMVGPNCMGIINTNPEIRLNGTFVRGTPIYGGIGFVSQSGALGAAILKTVQQYDIGLAHFISIGNKADVSENTILEYWKDNKDVKVITVYLESFVDPKKFMEITRAVTKSKPVIVIKAARTSAGMKAASSHTGALASSDSVSDALIEQSGAIRVDTTEEMFDIAKAFDKAKPPSGNRVGILTNSGGPAVLTVDECEKSGLVIPELSQNTINKLKEFTPKEAPLYNPVDLLPAADAPIWEKSTRIMLEDENIDALIVILGPPLMYDTVEIALSICNGAENSNKSVFLVLMSQDEIIPKVSSLRPVHPPIFRYPESAAKALGEMLKYEKWKNTPVGKYVKYDCDNNEVRKILNSQTQKGEFYIKYDDVVNILKAYKLPVIESIVAKDVEEAKKIAEDIGYPVVIKAVGKELIHKTEIGGVLVDIKNENELVNGILNMMSKLDALKIKNKLEGFLLQPYIKGGIETIIGVFKDVNAGHLIMFGMGGILVEVFRDVKFNHLPVTDVEAGNLVRSVKCYEMLKGIRGNPSVDIDYIEECILRISQLIQDFPEFSEIDFNPAIFKHNRKDCKILDARMKVHLL